MLNFVFEMKKNLSKYTKLIAALLLVSATQIAFASFTGSSDEASKNKYSLKNFNKQFYKAGSTFSLRAGFQYKGSQITSLSKTDDSFGFKTVMRFEKGNTTYIYPYKHQVIVSKFKTPVAPTVR